LLITFILSSFCQDEKECCLSRVKKRQGIEVYIMSEPLRSYEITGEVLAEDASSILNALAGEEKQKDITEQVDILISNAMRKKRKGKFDFDAIITDNGQKGICIKFTE